MTNTLTNEELMWLAGELGLQLDLRSSVVHYYPVINGIAQPSIPLDIESDTPDAAYLREKVVEWLGEKHWISIIKSYGVPYWSADQKYTGDITGEHDTRFQAIIAAVRYLYERREG